MPTANVNISEQQAKFIKQAIKRGRFQNTSEVVRAGLHLLKEQSKLEKARLDRLLKEIDIGFDEIDRGHYTTVTADTIDDFMKQFRPKRKKRTRTK